MCSSSYSPSKFRPHDDKVCVLLLSLISFESVLKKKVDQMFYFGSLDLYCRKCIVDAHVNKAAETTVTNQLGKTKNFLKESQDTPKHKRVFGKVTKEYFNIERRIFKVTFHKNSKQALYIKLTNSSSWDSREYFPPMRFPLEISPILT